MRCGAELMVCVLFEVSRRKILLLVLHTDVHSMGEVVGGASTSYSCVSYPVVHFGIRRSDLRCIVEKIEHVVWLVDCHFLFLVEVLVILVLRCSVLLVENFYRHNCSVGSR
jgi:hypothetical protein